MIPRILLTLFFCSVLTFLCRAQEKDSSYYEYVRVSYHSFQVTAYYEDGKVEDLKSKLNINLPKTIYSPDSKISDSFFLITKYLRNKGYELVTSMYNHIYYYTEYIYKRKKIMKIDDKK